MRLTRYLSCGVASETGAKATVNDGKAYDDSNARKLFGPNYGRLQRLKAQYDPENVFSKWFAITPDSNA
jgi:FAD/FMN-containing dehydrogenase